VSDVLTTRALQVSLPEQLDQSLCRSAPANEHTRIDALYSESKPLVLINGQTIGPVYVAYETYGELNQDKSNAIFICHALTGDSHVARHHSQDEPGWWETMVGPGRAVDTDRYFVVCANALGGCGGTTGPSSSTLQGGLYGLDFPEVHVRDMVSVHRTLMSAMGIRRFRAVIGGSLGGMQSLQWLMDAPQEADIFFIIAASARLTAENLAWHAISRLAIRGDLDFKGAYSQSSHGLAVARMVAHLTYLCEDSLEARFGRRRGPSEDSQSQPHHVAVGPYEIERYLEHQGAKLVRRFDAASYLYLTRAMDSFEPFSAPLRSISTATSAELFSFSSDRLFGYRHSRFIYDNLTRLGMLSVHHHHEDADSVGHDAFLLQTPHFLGEVEALLSEQRPTIQSAHNQTLEASTA
jgi:homoserine O-acetyltransferase